MMKALNGAIAATMLVALAPASEALAQGATVSSPLELAEQASKLKPGQWVWAPQLSPDGPMLVYVDLTRQIATVYRNGVRIAVSTISSGRAGHETPTGVFTILQKDADHHSSTYNNAPMPFTERLTWGGVALHAGGLPGYPSSHGCVHLPYDFAKALFGIESLGGTVIITGGFDEPNSHPAAGILEPAVAGDSAPAPIPAGESYSWTPQARASGPVSIIVSTKDQQVLVLRNGVEIGRSKAQVQPVTGTNVLTLAPGKPDHWIEVGARGPGGPAGAISPGIEQLKLPPAFDTAMRSVMVPGTTLVVTDAPVSQSTTGTQTTLIDTNFANK